MDFSKLERRVAVWGSTYDPKHNSQRGRQYDKSAATYTQAYGSRSDWITPLRSEPATVYTKEQHVAFAEAIRSLCDANPVPTKNRKRRKKLKARAAAIHFAGNGSPNRAFAQAIYGGLPKQQLRAIEALIFM
jgi:hypothetical protein